MASPNVVEITDSNFESAVLKSDKPVLIDFWAVWCGPCQMIAPIIDQLADEYKDKVVVGKCDTDANSETPMNYGIRGIPTLLLFKDGQLVDKHVGVAPKNVIQQKLDAVLA